MAAESNGRIRIPEMHLEFGTWEGEYQGNPAVWMRAWDLMGRLIPTGQENAARMKQRVESEKQRADTEKQRAEGEKQRADGLAAKLRELGIDPDRI